MTGHARRTRSGPRTPRSWGPPLAACAAVLLVLLAALRVLFSDATAEAAEAPAGSASASDGATPQAILPAPSPEGPQSLPVPEGGPPPSPEAPAGSTPTAGRFASLASLPHETFRGRVLDPDGQPVAGAVVSFVPGHAAFHALGQEIWWEHQLEPDDLPRTTTNADGVFSLDGPHLTRCADGELLGDTWATEPGLVAWAPGFAAHPHVCIGYRGGPCDVGDLLVEAEARLHGRVVDADGRPVEGVVVRYVVDRLLPARLPEGSVSCDDDMIEIFLRARTDDDGRFALRGLWQGQGELVLRSETLLTMSIDNVRPLSGQDLDVGTLTMEAGGSLTGTVVDADGRPILDAEVVLTDEVGSRPRWPEVELLLGEQAFGDPFARRLVVDDAGRFRASGLHPAWTFALFARSPAHDVALLDELDPDGGDHVLSLTRAATLRVEVLDIVSGEPLPGALVAARRVASTDDEERLIPLAVEPSPDGVPGTWLVPRAGRDGTLLIVSAAGHATQTHRAEGLPAGARRDETVRLAPQLGVTGRVEGRDGAPIAEATLKASLVDLARGQFDDTWPTAKTDAEGRYELAGIGPGTWQIEAEAKGFVPADPASVEVGDVAPTHDFVLTEAATISGLAVRHDGRPAIGASVTLQHWDAGLRQVGDPVAELPIDFAGRFLFDGLRAGSYRLHWAGSRIVSVAAGDDLELELREPRHPVVHATVLDHGVRTEDAFVRVLRWTDTLGVEGDTYISSKPEGGGFRLELPEAGTYVLLATTWNRSSSSGKTTVTLDWGEEHAIELLLGTTQVTGQLVDRVSGEAVESGWVTLIDADDDELQLNTRETADGVFTFAGVMPGRYRLIAGANDHLLLSLDAVDVPAEGPLDLGAVALEPAARLQVLVRSALGAEGPDVAIVYVVNESKDDIEQAEYQHVDSPNTFSLPPGRHWVFAVPGREMPEDDSWKQAPGMQAVELVAGQEREVVLVLQ